MKKAILAAVLAAGLSACAGAVPGNPQGYSGINHGRVSFYEDVKPREISVYGGKESGTVSLTGKLPDGTEFAYTATDTRSFDGQAIRGAVEQAVSSDAADVAPGIVDAITGAVITVLTGSP